jgi:hypothetical protein
LDSPGAVGQGRATIIPQMRGARRPKKNSPLTSGLNSPAFPAAYQERRKSRLLLGLVALALIFFHRNPARAIKIIFRIVFSSLADNH